MRIIIKSNPQLTFDMKQQRVCSSARAFNVFSVLASNQWRSNEGIESMWRELFGCSRLSPEFPLSVTQNSFFAIAAVWLAKLVFPAFIRFLCRKARLYIIYNENMANMLFYMYIYEYARHILYIT